MNQWTIGNVWAFPTARTFLTLVLDVGIDLVWKVRRLCIGLLPVATALGAQNLQLIEDISTSYCREHIPTYEVIRRPNLATTSVWTLDRGSGSCLADSFTTNAASSLRPKSQFARHALQTDPTNNLIK
jgi:hypothetical protein